MRRSRPLRYPEAPSGRLRWPHDSLGQGVEGSERGQLARVGDVAPPRVLDDTADLPRYHHGGVVAPVAVVGNPRDGTADIRRMDERRQQRPRAVIPRGARDDTPQTKLGDGLELRGRVGRLAGTGVEGLELENLSREVGVNHTPKALAPDLHHRLELLGRPAQVQGQPYGGMKESGLGREHSLEGMLESYTELKAVSINLDY